MRVEAVKRITDNGGELFGLIEKYRGKKGCLIPLLQEIQELNNWLPEESLRAVSRELEIPLIDIYGVATFYKAFSLKPRGRHVITACLGTACHVRGAPRLVDELKNQLGINPGETTADMQFTLETVNCLGACALGPVVVIDGEYHGQMTASKLAKTLDQIRAAHKDTRKYVEEVKKSERAQATAF